MALKIFFQTGQTDAGIHQRKAAQKPRPANTSFHTSKDERWGQR